VKIRAVIQAGGRGTRLMPYTLVLPKPIMPVGESPVIEILLKWLRRNGITDVNMTIGYLGALIRTFCGDGSTWDMKIEYYEEKEPLGTVGSLPMMPRKFDDTFLVLNGDVITDVNLRKMKEFHKEKSCPLTVAVTTKKVHVDLGVIDAADSIITKFREKPVLEFCVSMGIYIMEPTILEYIPKGIAFGFDDLVHALMAENRPIAVFNHDGYWMDIGRPDDFRTVQEEYETHKNKILGV